MIEFKEIHKFEINDFDTSSQVDKYVVCYLDRYFEVSKGVVQLIEMMKKCDTKEELCVRFSSERNMEITEEQMNKIVEQCITPILASCNTPQPKPFLVRLDLLSADVVSKVSKVLKFLFNPIIGLSLIAIILTLHLFFYASVYTGLELGRLDILTMLGILLFFVISSCFHELGHAASCQYFGIEHGSVGFGLYLTFPVFYTDVSKVWTLSRKKRLVVNFAGVYFQLIFLIPFLLFYFLTNNPIARYFIITVNLNFLITLNPFFKFDGYWIISDLLGVPNLRTRTQEVFKYYMKKIRRKPAGEKPFLFTMTWGKKIFMAVYIVIMNAFFVFVFCYMMPLFVYRFFNTFPGLVKELVHQIAVGGLPSFSLIKLIFSQLLFFGFISFALYKTLRPRIDFLMSKINFSRSAK